MNLNKSSRKLTWATTIMICAILLSAGVAAYLGANITVNVENLVDVAIREYLEMELNSSFYVLQKPVSYLITQVGAYTCLQNGTDGKLDGYSTNATLVQEWANGNLSASGGVIHLKEVQWNSSIVVNDLVLVMEDYQGITQYFSPNWNGYTMQPPLQEASYIIGQYNASHYYAKNHTGYGMAANKGYEFLSSNASYIIDTVDSSVSEGNVFVKTGTYNLDSVTLDNKICWVGEEGTVWNLTATPTLTINAQAVFINIKFIGASNGVQHISLNVNAYFTSCEFDFADGYNLNQRDGFWMADFEEGDLSEVETQITGGGTGNVTSTSSIVWSGVYAVNCSATSGAGGQKARIALGLGNPIPIFTTSAKYGIRQPLYMGGMFYIRNWNTSLDLSIMDFRCLLDMHPYGTDTQSWVAWVNFLSGGNTIRLRSSYPEDVYTFDPAQATFSYNTASLIGDWHFFQLGAYINEEGWIKFWIDGSLVAEMHPGNSHTIEAHGHHSYQVENCEDAWTAKANVVCDVDNSDYKEGSNSATMEIADGFTTGLIATEDFTALELSGYRNFVFWLKSNVTLDAGDLQFVYDETAACASPLQTLDLPYIPADVWVKIKIPKISVVGDNLAIVDAIISVGLNATRDFGVVQLKIDDVRAEELTVHIDKVYSGISPIGPGTSYTEIIIDDWFLSETYVNPPNVPPYG